MYINDSDQSFMYAFVKEHSYGEYIFDWDWANFYHQHNIPYYPKLTSMIPFSSVTATHLLGSDPDKAMRIYQEFYEKYNFSSSHFLFITIEERNFFKKYDYLLRDSFQYHFQNENYLNFENFLLTLKNKKAKQIRKERIFSKDIKFKHFSGDLLTEQHAKEMYLFYLETIKNKGAISYLKESFFILTFKRLKNNICYIQATEDNKPIAGSLYFYSDTHLYGRYWGAIKDMSNLHFELCFYQGIEFCIKKGLKVFEAGAQGEHKIARGFKPVKTYSAHKFKHPEFHKAIEHYIKTEKDQIKLIMDELSKRLPFKKT